MHSHRCANNFIAKFFDTHNPVNPVNYVSENYISNFSIFISPQSLMIATFLTNGSEAE